MDSCLRVGHFAKRIATPVIALVLLVLFAAPLVIVAIKLAALTIVGVIVWVPMHTLVLGRSGWWQRSSGVREQFQKQCGNAAHLVVVTYEQTAYVVTCVLHSIGSLCVEVACGASCCMFIAFTALGPGEHIGVASIVGVMLGLAVCISRKTDR